MINAQYINLNMVPNGVIPVLHCSQYDIGRPLGVAVYNGSETVDLSEYTAMIEATRTDGAAIMAEVAISGNTGTFATTATMTNNADKYFAQLVLVQDGKRVASIPFVMCVVPAAMDENSEAIQEDASLFSQFSTSIQSALASVTAESSANSARIDNLIALQTEGSMQGSAITTFVAQSAAQFTSSGDWQSFSFCDYSLHYNTTPSMSVLDGLSNPVLLSAGAYVLASQSASITDEPVYVNLTDDVRFYNHGYLGAAPDKRAVEIAVPKVTDAAGDLAGMWLLFTFSVVSDVPVDLSEVTDIRVGADGATYPTAGDAVRTQFNSLKTKVDELDTTVGLPQYYVIPKAYITSNGTVASANTYDLYVAQVQAGTHISFTVTNADSIIYAFYASKPYIGSQSFNNSRTTKADSTVSNIIVPDNCNWVAVRADLDKVATFTNPFVDGLLEKTACLGSYVTPEQYGAVGDGVTDDTAAFQSALSEGLPVVACGNYLIGTLSLSGKIFGFGVGIIKCNFISLQPTAVLDGLELSSDNSYVVKIDTTNNQTNTTIYNSHVKNCTIIAAADGSAIYFYLLNGRGVVSAFFEDIIIKSSGNGFAAIRIHSLQNAPSRPWMSPIVCNNVICIDSPFQYFIYCDDYEKSDPSYSSSFFKFVFSGCQMQYYNNVTRYCGYIRSMKNVLFNIITYDFPQNRPIYYLSETNNSIEITELPLSHNDLMSAVAGVSGYERNVYAINNKNYRIARYGYKSEVYDSVTDTGNETPFAYELPVMYPVGFTDGDGHKINGVAIPQNKSAANTAEGSFVIGYDNTDQELCVLLYKNETWEKHQVLID